MPDLSLSKMLQRRRKIRIVTVVCALILIGALVGIFVSKNPRGTKAGTTINATAKTVTISGVGTTARIDGGLLTGGSYTNSPVSGYAVTVEDSAVLTLYSTSTVNNFKSLTIQSSAKVTHDAPIPTTDFNTTNGVLTPTGNAKKVDLKIDDDLTLDSGGSINVDGLGYPGGEAVGGGSVPYSAQDGYGYLDGANFGGGGRIEHNEAHQENYASSAGGGYGGSGGAGVDLGHTYETTATPGDSYPVGSTGTVSGSTFLFGSGAGGAVATGDGKHTRASGGAGGGRIHLEVNGVIYIKDANSKISANGASGTVMHDDATNSYSGGGSGGTIWIEAGDFQYTLGSASFSPILANPGTYRAGIVAEPTAGTIQIAEYFQVNSFYNITANGGDAGYQNPLYGTGGGGGGRIMIDRTVNQPVTIKKTLESKYRAGAGNNGDGDGDSNDNFNPYALQVGDIIKVNLAVSNYVTGLLTLQDERLNVKYGSPAVYCEYNTGTEVVPSGAVFDDTDPALLKINYTVPVGTAGDLSFSYECTVKSP